MLQAGRSARLVIIGQAPGSKVHESGVPWRDQSGDRLRDWTGPDEATFYDPSLVALIPMGFCPGAANGADLPPRLECAPLWHARLLTLLPKARLTLLVGIYSQNYYLRDQAKSTMTETVRAFKAYGPDRFPYRIRVGAAPDGCVAIPGLDWRFCRSFGCVCGRRSPDSPVPSVNVRRR